MKEKISEYYKQKGFIAVYVAINKEPRRVATLRHKNGTMTSMSYAKYLYTSYYSCEIEEGYEIDHINGNKLDDRVENLQKLSASENRSKNHIRKTYIVCTCPVCGTDFIFPKANISTHPNPCCSRKCGGIKSHWNK